jgi:hypothetical protein
MATLTTSGLDQLVAAADTRRSGKGLFARFIASVQDARMRQAEREIGRLIELKGGRMTDDLERQIERDFI